MVNSTTHAPVADRRLCIRFPANDGTSSHVRETDESVTVAAKVSSFSHSGIGLIVEREVGSGAMLQIDLPAAPDQSKSSVLAYARRAKKLANDEWLLECAFAIELDDETLAGLGGRRERPAPPDRRAWTRFPVLGSATYFQVGTHALSRRATILDLSPVGVGLIANENIEPGVVLSVELHCGVSDPFSILASVVYVSEKEVGRWLLGCQFIRELKESELRRLRDH